jgi:folate-binding protein YgfZ
VQIEGMSELALHEFHHGLGARFAQVNGVEVVVSYGDVSLEYDAFRASAGVIDLSFRGRLCLTGADRQRFLNGQVTNNVQALKVGEGCYAALISAKGKMLSDLNIFLLENEILLDFEPGLTAAVAQRLEKYIIADDAQVVDVGPLYGLLSVQGPKAAEAVRKVIPAVEAPANPLTFATWKDEGLGELYLVNMPRLGSDGFDLYVPTASLAMVFDRLLAATKEIGGAACGWDAMEIARIEAGIPRFGIDMDETNLPPEAGLEARAISYTKGCYIGQEVIARIRTYGQVAKALRGLRLPDNSPALPVKGDKLFKDGREIGFITSATTSPESKAKIALAYVRREANQIGTTLRLRSGDSESDVTIVDLPFRLDGK